MSLSFAVKIDLDGKAYLNLDKQALKASTKANCLGFFNLDDKEIQSLSLTNNRCSKYQNEAFIVVHHYPKVYIVDAGLFKVVGELFIGKGVNFVGPLYLKPGRDGKVSISYRVSPSPGKSEVKRILPTAKKFLQYYQGRYVSRFERYKMKRDMVERSYAYISDTLKNPKTQPQGSYYGQGDGFTSIFKGKHYKTNIVRVMSNSKGCRGGMLLVQYQDNQKIDKFLSYDLRKQSFYIKGDKITLRPDDIKSTLEVTHEFRNSEDKYIKEKKQYDYLQFSWRAFGRADYRLKKAFLQYSNACKR